MNSSHKSGNSKPGTFIGLIAIIAGALGGFTALFLGFGYITITCFLSNVKLYGLAEFPVQFYREASVRLLTETVGFYSKKDFYFNHWYMIPLTVFIILIPIIHRRRKKLKGGKEDVHYNFLIKCFKLICLGFIFIVLFLTIYLEKMKMNTNSTIGSNEIIFFAISLPVLISLFLHLFFNYKDFDFRKPFKTIYGFFFLSFILIFISIPIGYGTSIYDISLYEIEPPECDGTDVFRKATTEGFDLLFLMGHTRGREIFSYATDIPPRLILVDRNSIKSIEVKYEHKPKMSIRKLFSGLPRVEIEPSDVKKLQKEEEEEWFKK